MTTPTVNFRAALSQYEAALAAYEAAVGELHAEHVRAIGCGREALNGETRIALGAVAAASGLDHKILDGKLTLLAAQVTDVSPEEVEAAIAGLQSKKAASVAAQAALADARKKLDAVFTAAANGAEKTCGDLTALLKSLAGKKK